MSPDAHATLSRRERQIMEVIYRLGSASAQEVLEGLPDPPSYSSVRALLRILEEKGHLTHSKDGPRYIYSPKRARARAAKSALEQVVSTFFENSTEQAVAALLDANAQDLSDAELERLSNLVDAAKQKKGNES